VERAVHDGKQKTRRKKKKRHCEGMKSSERQKLKKEKSAKKPMPE